jgi:predicted  nucleic acid-binding Zn-ribbon protein
MANTAHKHDHLPVQALVDRLAQLEQQLAQGQAYLSEGRARHHSALSEVKIARAAASDLSWELADLEQRLRDLQEQREGPGDQLLERELASVAGRRAALEEQVLAQMLLVDELAARAAAEERALAAEEQALAARMTELSAERERIVALLEEGRSIH